MPTITIQKLVRISRPRFWIYLFGPFLLGLTASDAFSSLAHFGSDLGKSALALGYTPCPFSCFWFPAIALVLLALYFTFPANVLVYGINDLFDYETDRHNPKKSTYETLVTPQERKHLVTAIILSQLPFVPAFVIVGLFWPWAIVALVGFLFFGVFYSAPPIRAKTKPMLDSFFNVLYVFPGVFAFLIYNDPKNFQLPLFLSASLWCMAMHAYSAVPDIKSDTDAGLKTIATTLGKKRTIWLCICLYAGAALLAASTLTWLAYLIGIIYLVLMALSLRTKSEHDFFLYYKLFPWINTAIGAALFLFLLLTK